MSIGFSTDQLERILHGRAAGHAVREPGADGRFDRTARPE
jgi:hypothetical protein